MTQYTVSLRSSIKPNKHNVISIRGLIRGETLQHAQIQKAQAVSQKGKKSLHMTVLEM